MKDAWGERFRKESSKDIMKFTSTTGFLPFSIDSFNTLTKQINEKDRKILEAGHGSGRNCIGLAEKFPKSKITGIDLSKDSVMIARLGAKKRGLKNASFIKGDIFHLPFKNNYFDVCFNQGVIEHFHDYESIIKEMIRVTKKGGKIIVAVPNKHNLHRFYSAYQKKKKLNVAELEILFTRKRLKETMDKLGRINVQMDGTSVMYRLSKLRLKSSFWNNFFRVIAIFLEYIIQALDLISFRFFSKHFGFEIIASAVK
jgi:ubiquinone/menaquinone biosynthesis C-methylase UbiE